MNQAASGRHYRVAWSALEDALMRDLYPDVTCVDMAALLGRKPGSVYDRAQKLGLTKSEHFWQRDARDRGQRLATSAAMRQTQFRPGVRPWNTGISYTAGGRSAETRFKPGRPATEARNYVPIGSYRITKDGYLERKVTDDPSLVPARRWTAVHRLVWQAAHGDIPAGHVVTFLPGRRSVVLEQITADALECVSRAEIARRNSPSDPEIFRLCQLKGAITRQVRRLEKLTPESESHE